MSEESDYEDANNAYMDDSRFDYEEGVNEFPVSEVDWGEETWGREDHHGGDSWQGEIESQFSIERGYEAENPEYNHEPNNGDGESFHERQRWHEEALEGSWEDKTDSEISYGEEEWHEGEPYTQDQRSWNNHSTHEFSPQQDYPYDSREEYGDENYQSESWQIRSYLEEAPELESAYGQQSQHQGYEEEETDSHFSLEDSKASFGEEPEQQDDLTEEEDVISEVGRDDYDPKYINFSGHSQGPEAYLRWERNLENWFQSNQIPEKEKTSYAEETLTGEAFMHWDLDANLRLEYQVPNSSWEEMKELLQEEFVGKAELNQQCYVNDLAYSEPRRWILSTCPTPTTKRKKNRCPKPKKVMTTIMVMDPRKKAPMVITSKSPREENFNSSEGRGVILSYLLKGEPPDMFILTTQQACQNLTVSRSKPFEEGEYDVEIKSLPTKEQWEDTKELTKILKEVQPERSKDIGVLIGEYRPNQEDLSYESTCSRNSTYQGVMEKKNRFKILPHKEDIQLTSWRISHEPEGDQQILIEALRLDQDETSCKTTCSRKITHQGITESWIHIKPGSELEVIEVTSWQTSFRTPSAIGPEIELHSPTHSQSRPPTTWIMLMGLSWFQKAQETEKQPTEAQVITQSPDHVSSVLFKVNYRPDRFSNNQTYVWRPGETLNQSGESYSIFPYTSKHRIRRIPFPSHFPYLEPSALKLQQLYPFLLAHDLDASSTFKKVPRHHHFMPKLSRYKEPRAYLD